MSANYIYTNGIIHTLDESCPLADSMALEGERILAVGRKEDMMPYHDDSTVWVDLKGCCVVPGFYDSHGHFSLAAAFYEKMINLSPAPIGEMHTIEDCIEKIKQYVDEHPEMDFVLGWGFDETMIDDKRHLTREDLDKASVEKCIIVMQSSNHIAYCNSKVLALANIDQSTKDPEGGSYGRDEKGYPNGILEETAFRNLNLPKDYLQKMYGLFNGGMEEIEKNSHYYASMGVTTANDGSGQGAASLKLYSQAAEAGKLKIRLNINPFLNVREEMYAIKDYHPLISLHGVKILDDGSIQLKTAYVKEPYYTPYHEDKDWKGYPSYPLAELKKHIIQFYAEGRQPICHCNGDATIDEYLDAIEEAQKQYPSQKDLRPLVIHSQMATREQLKRMKALGVYPSFFHLHTYYWGEMHRNVTLGPERASNIDPIGWALEEGVVFTTHCDTPVVPQTPLLSIWSCVNRLTSAGKVLGEHQCISVEEALKSYTINAAFQYHEENDKGSLTPGKLADFVVLAEDIFKVKKEAIKDIAICATYVGGQCVYEQ